MGISQEVKASDFDSDIRVFESLIPSQKITRGIAMKIINVGNIYEPVNDSVKVHDFLPPASYVVRFNKQKGFFLEKYLEISQGEEKVYGVHDEKVQKVLKSFAAFERNLGVILSGKKGIGKSLFARMLSEKSIESGIPVIVVDTYLPGVASYLESIEQEVLILMDEFDKTYAGVETPDGEADPQVQFLSLFDGISGGKKLFVITCNDINKLNEFLVNRPGRFHYHFRFEYPTPDEITEYLTDKLAEEYRVYIPEVINFSRRVRLNYDCLRAIAFEINSGCPFKDAIKDLNILNIDGGQRYNAKLVFDNGIALSSRSTRVDLFGEENHIHFYDQNVDFIVSITFNGKNCNYNEETGTMLINSDKFDEIEWSDYVLEDENKKEKYKDRKSLLLLEIADKDNNLQYLI